MRSRTTSMFLTLLLAVSCPLTGQALAQQSKDQSGQQTYAQSQSPPGHEQREEGREHEEDRDRDREEHERDREREEHERERQRQGHEGGEEDREHHKAECNVQWNGCVQRCNTMPNPYERAGCIANCNNFLNECYSLR